MRVEQRETSVTFIQKLAPSGNHYQLAQRVATQQARQRDSGGSADATVIEFQHGQPQCESCVHKRLERSKSVERTSAIQLQLT